MQLLPPRPVDRQGEQALWHAVAQRTGLLRLVREGVVSDTVAERAQGAIAAKHGDVVARSIQKILTELGLMLVAKPDYEQVYQRRATRHATDETYRAETRRCNLRSKHRTQGSTLPSAHRRGQPWTGPELELAARPDLSAVQVAEMIGRTYHAVANTRRRLLVDPRAIQVAGLPR